MLLEKHLMTIRLFHAVFIKKLLILRNPKGAFFPAASFMSFQNVKFNFGKDAFKYPPSDYKFKNFKANKHFYKWVSDLSNLYKSINC